MASLKDQVIPPELAEAYLRALGTVRPNTYPGGIHPDHLQNAQQTGRGRPEPPFIPTQNQLLQRAIFKAASNCFNATSEQERRAYYRLSKITGQVYRNYYLSRHILAYLASSTCAQEARPLALSLMSHMGYTLGGVQLYPNDMAQHTVTYDVELDPATYKQHGYACISYVYQIIQWWWSSEHGAFVCKCLKAFTPNPTARIRYIGTCVAPPPDPDDIPSQRRIAFWRNALDVSETVAWYFNIEPPGLNPVPYNFD